METQRAHRSHDDVSIPTDGIHDAFCDELIKHVLAYPRVEYELIQRNRDETRLLNLASFIPTADGTWMRWHALQVPRDVGDRLLRGWQATAGTRTRGRVNALWVMEHAFGLTSRQGSRFARRVS